MKIEKIISKLNEPDPNLRIEALRELTKIKDKDSITIITKLVNDEDEEVRTELAMALSALRDIEGADALLKLSHDEDTAVRMEAVNGLGVMGELGFEQAKDRLEMMLDDPNVKVRKYAIKALGLCGDANSIDKLVKIFDRKETSLEIKEIIAETIGKIGGSHAIHLLNSWISEGTMEVRREAIKALGFIGSETAVDRLIKIIKDKKEAKIIKNHARFALKTIVEKARKNYLELEKKIKNAL